MNIDLLRAAQKSIADRTRLFNMARWDTCICGHILQAAGVTEAAARFEANMHGKTKADLALEYTGLHKTSYSLFLNYAGSDEYNRERAIEAIEELIQAHLAQQNSALEPCAQRAAARAESNEERIEQFIDETIEELVCA